MDPSEVANILHDTPPFVEAVGVFVNRPLCEIFAFIGPWRRLRTVQWHGEECEPGDGRPYRLIPAFPVRDATSLEAVTRHLDACRAEGGLPAAVLLDGHVPGQYGGTGRRPPWEMIAAFGRACRSFWRAD